MAGIRRMTDVSIEKALSEALSFSVTGEFADAERLYSAILKAFPNEKIAAHELKILNGMADRSPHQNPSEETIENILKSFRSGDFETCVQLGENCIRQHPTAYFVWNILGAAYQSLGEISRAANCFANVTRLHPFYAEGFNNLGVTSQTLGEHAKSIEAYKRAIFLNPSYIEALNNLASALAAHNEFEQAEHHFKTAINLKPNHADTHFNFGNLLMQQQKFDLALVHFDAVISTKADHAGAYVNSGVCLHRIKKNDVALERLRKAILLTPENFLAHYNLGIVSQYIGNTEIALQAFTEAVKIIPSSAEAYACLGACQDEFGYFSEALKSYETALNLNPKFSEVHLNIGNVCRKQGEFGLAVQAYQTALETNPGLEKAHNNLGVCFREMRRFDDALSALEDAVVAKSNYPEAYYNIASVYQEMGLFEQAIANYRKALGLQPDYDDAYANMGVCLKNIGKIDQAIKSFDKAISINPNHAKSHKNLSFIFLQKGMYEKGLDKYEWRWVTDELSGDRRYFEQPQWSLGQPLENKAILLWSEQGVGDTVNWASKANTIAERAGQCIMECPEKLIPLFSRSFPNIKISKINRAHDLVRKDFDFHLPMGSIYRHFIKDDYKCLGSDSFLKPDPERTRYWSQRLRSLGDGPFIGINWKSSVMSPARVLNYAPISAWSNLFAKPRCKFINLQYSNFSDDLVCIKEKYGVDVHVFSELDYFNDLDDVAALCSALDCVVSTIGSVPLIAAGVGTPTKLAMWRQSPWNNILFHPVGPSVRIYEKNTWEEWDDTFLKIAEDLA